MPPFELTNDQRKYFGLSLVKDDWDKVRLSDTMLIYYEGNKIAKVLTHKLGYFELDTAIETQNRQLLLPRTTKGKPQKLTIARISKVKGSGIWFSASFQGGGIHVYDNRRNLFFIRSYQEEGTITSYSDIERWITAYINNSSSEYFDWLNKELTQKRLRIKFKEGDIIAFKIAQDRYGFARILVDVFDQRKKGTPDKSVWDGFHSRSLIIAVYAFSADTLQIDTKRLVQEEKLPAICIFDLDVYRGQMPVVGHQPLTEADKRIPYPHPPQTCITIPYTKTDIETFISEQDTEHLPNY